MVLGAFPHPLRDRVKHVGLFYNGVVPEVVRGVVDGVHKQGDRGEFVLCPDVRIAKQKRVEVRKQFRGHI